MSESRYASLWYGREGAGQLYDNKLFFASGLIHCLLVTNTFLDKKNTP